MQDNSLLLLLLFSLFGSPNCIAYHKYFCVETIIIVIFKLGFKLLQKQGSCFILLYNVCCYMYRVMSEEFCYHLPNNSKPLNSLQIMSSQKASKCKAWWTQPRRAKAKMTKVDDKSLIERYTFSNLQVLLTSYLFGAQAKEQARRGKGGREVVVKVATIMESLYFAIYYLINLCNNSRK